MNPSEQELFRVWDNDNTVYGPIGLSTLIQWIHEDRVLPETFIQTESGKRWHRAADLAPLQKHLASKQKRAPGPAHFDRVAAFDPDELRQFACFSNLADEELEQFAALGDCFQVAPGKLIVKEGAPGDAIYFVFFGTLRVRLLIGVEKYEEVLCKISGGEFFGEVGLFLRCARTADVVAETEVRLLRMSSNAFQLLVKQTPELAAPILFALAATMAGRIAAGNQQFARETTPEFLWR
jgi:CRP-like cAMP-binding protein